MDSLQTISNDLVQSISEKEKKKSIPYDTYAKVIRIDGGTAWVHIPGGVDETPVVLTVNAKAGDSVLVRVSGGNAWIVGNSSAPPTDDTKAVEAKGVADVAQVKAASAQETAESAEEIAKDASRAVKSTSQYFWHTETDTGAGAGAHITEVPQEDFLDDPANGGGNLLAQSGGIQVRDGLYSLAEFGQVARVGARESSRVEIDPGGVYVKSESGVDALAIETGTGQESQTVTYSVGKSWMTDQTKTINETVNKLSTFASGTSFNAKFVIYMVRNGNTVQRTETLPFVKGTSSSGGSSITVTYNGTTGFAITMTVSGTTELIRTTFSQISWEKIVYTSKLDMTGTVSVKGDISVTGNIDMAGTLQNFFSIANLEVSVGQVAAHAQNNIGTVTVPTADRPDGMTLVGIVGVACNNYRVVPYNYYVNGTHSINCAVVNTTTAQSAAGTTMTFKLLYAKMASA